MSPRAVRAALLATVATATALALVYGLQGRRAPCAASGSEPTAQRTSAMFTYGFDLSTQEPDPSRLVPANVPAAVASARRVLASLPGVFVDQAIWGFGVNSNPEPSPGAFDMKGIAARIAMIQAAGDTPVITLVSAPNWMKGSPAGQKSLFATPPAPEHYQDFAALAAHVAASFPEVKYFVVWSEMRGFWSPQTRSWDYQDYTAMYNDVYQAIKRVRPDALVGGPYADMYSQPTPVRGVPSLLHGPWGYLDQGMLDTLSYWLAHKVGADFVAVDGSTEIGKTGSGRLTNAVTAAGQYAAVDTWIRSQTNLPIWWMESHIQPSTGWTAAQGAAARIATLAEMAASGARVGMQWQPQEQTNWPDEGLWTSTRVSGGGKPTPLARELPAALPVLDHSPQIVGGEPPGVLVARDGAGLLAVNTTDRRLVAAVGSARLSLSSGQVLIRACGGSVGTRPPQGTARRRTRLPRR